MRARNLVAALAILAATPASAVVLFVAGGSEKDCTVLLAEERGQAEFCIQDRSEPLASICDDGLDHLDLARQALGLGSCGPEGERAFDFLVRQENPEIDHFVFVDDRNMSVDVRARFQQALMNVNGTLMLAPHVIKTADAKSLLVGVQYPAARGFRPDAWKNLVRSAVSTFNEKGETEAVGLDGKRACHLGTDYEYVKDAAGEFYKAAENMSIAQAAALREIERDMNGNQVEEKFDLSREIGRAMLSELLSVGLTQLGEGVGKAIGGSSAGAASGASAGGGAGSPALIAATAAFNIFLTVTERHDEVEKTNRKARQKRATADVLNELDREILELRLKISEGQAVDRLARRYCVMDTAQRKEFVAILRDLRQKIMSNEAPLKPNQDALVLAMFEAYLRAVPVEGGGTGHVKVLYRYKHDERADTYEFKQVSSKIIAPRGPNIGQRLDKLIAAIHGEAPPSHIFLLDVPKKICTVGYFWTEGGPGELAEKCGGVSRDNQSVKPVAVGIFHHNAQRRLFSKRSAWMEEWTKFDDDWEGEYR